MKHFLTILGFLLCTTVHAQPQPYSRFDNLGGKTQHLCIRSIAQTFDGMMWIGTEEGLYSYDGCHLMRRDLPTSHKDTQQDGSWGSLNFMLTDTDSLLIGSERGMLSFDLHTYTLHPLPCAEGKMVKGLVRTQGHWWAATADALYRDGVAVPISTDGIFSLGADSTYLYIGTRERGMRYHTERQTLEEVVGSPYITTSFATLPDATTLWIGTARTILAWDKQQQSVTFNHEVHVAKTMCHDGLGNLLVGTDNGLIVVNKQGVTHSIHHDARMSESLAGDAVWSLFRDHDGNIWIGTNNGLSMVANDNRLTTYTLPSITGESSGNQIFCLCRDPQGRLWLGGSNGLLCINNLGEANQDFRWYRMDNPHYPLTHNRIRTIFADSKGRLWVGGDGGLLLLNEHTKQFDRLEIADDHNNWVYDIHEAEDGHIAITTLDATYIVQPNSQTLELKVVHKTPPKSVNALKQEHTQLLTRYNMAELYLSAHLDTATHTLLLGGTDRFALLHTNPTTLGQKGAAIVVTDIKVNGHHLMSHQQVITRTVTFSPDETILQFLFSDFDYNELQPHTYSYRITGQKEWVDIPASDRSITLTNLKAGTYELYIRRNSPSPSVNEELPVFTFTLKAPWYATTLAKILYALMLAGLLYGIHHIVQQHTRLRQERQELARLLAQAKEKERELLNDNEYLANQLRLQLIEKSGEEGKLSADEKFLLDITRIIEEHMDDSALNVDTLSRWSGIGTKQLYRRIKALTGMTTVAYIRDQRLKKAASLLAKGSFTVSEVMYRVGFSSASYFTRCFCDEYGVPPSEYKV